MRGEPATSTSPAAGVPDLRAGCGVTVTLATLTVGTHVVEAAYSEAALLEPSSGSVTQVVVGGPNGLRPTFTG